MADLKERTEAVIRRFFSIKNRYNDGDSSIVIHPTYKGRTASTYGLEVGEDYEGYYIKIDYEYFRADSEEAPVELLEYLERYADHMEDTIKAEKIKKEKEYLEGRKQLIADFLESAQIP